jgi:hypothetical protein
VYAVTAYMLNLNGLVGSDTVLDARSTRGDRNAEPRRV